MIKDIIFYNLLMVGIALALVTITTICGMIFN